MINTKKFSTIDSFFKIMEYKKTIFFITFLVTLFTGTYQYFNNPTPVYKGSLLIQIGEKSVKNIILKGDEDIPGFLEYRDVFFNHHFYLSRPKAEKEILERVYPDIKVKVPYGSYSIFELLVENTDKEAINHRLEEVYKTIIIRHEKKALMYDTFTMTKKIGKVKFVQKNILKNKVFITIVTMVLSFSFSIYFIYILVVVKSMKNNLANKVAK